MKAYCYFRFYGLATDVAALSIDGALQSAGKVQHKLRGQSAAQHERKPTEWHSQKLVIESNDGENEMIDISLRMLAALGKSSRSLDVVIDLVIAREQRELHDSCGLYFSPKLIGVLARIGAGIDYDVVECIRMPD